MLRDLIVYNNKKKQSLYPVSVSALTRQRAETKDDKDGKAVIMDKEKKKVSQYTPYVVMNTVTLYYSMTGPIVSSCRYL